MQLLFDSLQLLAINRSIACICSSCKLIDVVSNRSQLLCYLNRPRFINFGGLHSIPHCPLFCKSWHAHLKTARCLLELFIFAVVHSKFNLSIARPIFFIRSLQKAPSLCSLFNCKSLHCIIVYFLLLYYLVTRSASSIFNTQRSILLLSQKCLLVPIYMGELRPFLFEKRHPQKLTHIKTPTHESSETPTQVGKSKKEFLDKPRRYFFECVNS